jgi:nitroreductase
MTTRAMRRFSDEPVTDEEIERILAAAVQAPSGGNIQPYQFMIVTDEDRRRAIGDLYRRAYDRYEPAVLALFPPFTDAAAQRRHDRNWAASRLLAETIGSVPAMVLVLMPRISMTVADDEGDMDVGPTYASVYPAVQNIVLAARSMGIGTVLTTVYRIHEEAVREVCGIPDRYEVVALLPLGRPTGHWGIAPPPPPPTITSWNQFGHRRP